MDVEELQRWVDEVPFHAQLGRLTIVRTGDGVELAAVLLPSGANEREGSVAHGGVAAALLDSSLSFALIAASGTDWTTVDLRVDYLRPVSIGPVRATGRVMRVGRRIGRAEGSLLDAEGAECARAVGAFVPVE